MSELPTLRVHNPAELGGYMIINESDFDPAVHKRFDGAPAIADQDAPAADASEVDENDEPADAPRRRGRPPKSLAGV